MEKELILDEVTTLAEKLREQALEGRQASLELSERVTSIKYNPITNPSSSLVKLSSKPTKKHHTKNDGRHLRAIHVPSDRHQTLIGTGLIIVNL